MRLGIIRIITRTDLVGRLARLASTKLYGLETSFWQKTIASNRHSDYRVFLRYYPDSVFASLAEVYFVSEITINGSVFERHYVN
jgi:hypothetical protein